ncbi:MAG: class I SAM-dependent methyltransferase [Oscillatoriaceae cyanobacterium Prado104]|jgi:SAM-dependent methyltransferase|nr:class I SAM-dependent methyltransferase [Oscillatoriaceae cyanobacterium Prado104]
MGNKIQLCTCCGSDQITYSSVLWDSLINEWGLSSYEVEYINRQQGCTCMKCHANLRSMALAKAIMKCFNYNGLFKYFIKLPRIQQLKILEINEAGSLTQYLSNNPNHTLASYPQVDLMCLPFPDRSYDLVVHSDTLEHIHDPIKALSESMRVLNPGGFCCFTIPIVVDRLTRTREGLLPSYHGESGSSKADLLVYTEYGADAWKQLVQAGFDECRIYSLEYPAAQALVGVKSTN